MGRLGKMRIQNLSAYALSSPIEPPQERRFLGGARRLLKRDMVLVVMERADGTLGVGPGGASSSAMREYFEDVSHASFARLVEEDIAPLVVDTEIESVEELHQTVTTAELPAFLESQVVAPLDVAYFDLKGKEHGTPVHELLNHGEASLELPLYASAGMYMAPEEYAEQAKAINAQGFGGYKYRPGLGLEDDLETLRLIRDAVGPDMDVMIDAHTWWKLGSQSYSLEEITDLVREMAAYDPYWLEEPVEPTAYEEYQYLAEATDVALAGGESEETPDGLRALGSTGAVDFLQGDVRHHRGFTGCWEIVEFCADQDIMFVPHHFGTHLGLVANAHLVAAAPGSDLLECPVFSTGVAGMYPFPLAEEILSTTIDITDGYLSVPTGPGLGVEVDFEVIDAYPYIEGPWTEFHYDPE